jgi:hypothetical protein
MTVHHLRQPPYGGEPAPSGWLDALPHHRHAFILGAGPNGLPHHRHEPDGLKIALNCAITVGWRHDIWMVYDQTAPRYPWFKTDTSAHKIFSTDLSRYADTTFGYIPTIHAVSDLQEGILHGGATIAGCAIQLAFWLGCERTTLIGIDQYGDRHFDGTIGAPKHYGRTWSTVKQIEKIIRLVTARGMVVDTVSRTELAVPLVKLW